MNWRSVASSLGDFIFQPSCELCGVSLSAQQSLCEGCAASLPRIKEPFCEKCGEEFPGNISDTFTCPNCSDIQFPFHFARPVLHNHPISRELIHQFKYAKAIHLAQSLAEIACEAFHDPRMQNALAEKWTLIPVPLHWRRKQHRFFNQSAEIAEKVAAQMQLPYADALLRNQATTTQTILTRQQRMKNLRGAFSLKKKYAILWETKPPKGIILFDDVLTTGSTARECTICLNENHIENVIVLSLMRG